MKLNPIEKSEDIYQKRVDSAIKIAKCLINGISIKDIINKFGYKRKHVWKVKTKKRWQDELVYFDFDNRIDFTDINNEIDVCNSEEITIGETKYRNINKYRNEVKPYYYIDERGNIFSTFTNRFIKPGCDKDGYLRVLLACDDPTNIKPKYKLIGVHSLVNLCYNGQPSSDLKNPTTDHIDGNMIVCLK